MKFNYVMLIADKKVHHIYSDVIVGDYSQVNVNALFEREHIAAGDLEKRNLQEFLRKNPEPGEVLRQVSFVAASVFETE